jgi:Zn-dependent protease with chaperone function
MRIIPLVVLTLVLVTACSGPQSDTPTTDEMPNGTGTPVGVDIGGQRGQPESEEDSSDGQAINETDDATASIDVAEQETGPPSDNAADAVSPVAEQDAEQGGAESRPEAAHTSDTDSPEIGASSESEEPSLEGDRPASSLPQPQVVKRPQPGVVSRFDIATEDDLLMAMMLRHAFVGDNVRDWPILGDLAAQVGDWINDFLDAQKIAEFITDGFPASGQLALEPLHELVADCAETMGMACPEVFVRRSSDVRAYSTVAGDHTVLVLTSELLELYEDRPPELRFIVGRELGHLMCDHVAMRKASYGILAAVQAIDVTVIPENYQRVLPTLAMGRFFRWCRESEMSADRAGLLCSGSKEAAFSALQRWVHGLKPDSAWIDPTRPDFDEDAYIREIKRWESEPFVEFIRYIQEFPREAPFAPERIAGLKRWSESEHYARLIERVDGPDDGQLVVIQTIGLAGLTSEDSPVKPYVVAYRGDQRLFHTKVGPKVPSVTWKNLNCPHRCMDGQPLFFEVFSSQMGYDRLLGGFVVYPWRGRTTYNVPIRWDWKERTASTRSAMAIVEVEFDRMAAGP